MVRLPEFFLSLLLSVLAAPRCHSEITAHLVNPAATDPALTAFLTDHHAYLTTTAPPRGKLFLFIPGTGAIPADYTRVTRTAAGLGFHAVSISYVNDISVNSICLMSPDPTLFEKVRLEVIDGTNRTDKVNVNRTNSIENRLIKFLQYLDAHWPAEGWGQFLGSDALLWSKIVVAGHSQGGGHAGIIAKQHEVARCVMFNATDWWGPGKRPANWIFAAGATPAHRHFAFAHVRDPIGKETFRVTWAVYALPQFGVPRFFEQEPGPPYGFTHQFWTDLEPVRTPTGGDNDYHNGTAVDWATPLQADGVTPVYQPLWEFLMAGPEWDPAPAITMRPDATAEIRYQTSTDVRYQLRVSDNLTTWADLGNPFTGDGNVRMVVDESHASRRFYQVRASWER